VNEEVDATLSDAAGVNWNWKYATTGLNWRMMSDGVDLNSENLVEVHSATANGKATCSSVILGDNGVEATPAGTRLDRSPSMSRNQ